jgi:hypothetical protein
MHWIRFVALLALSIWLGSLVFFPVVAQTAFSELPSSHMAGLVVRSSLIKLHWIGMVCGVTFLVCSIAYNRVLTGRARIFAATHVLVVLMLALTAISQFAIIPRMDAIRSSAGEIALLASNNPLRQQFDSLHSWSVRIEEAVLIPGLIVLYSFARRLAPKT